MKALTLVAVCDRLGISMRTAMRWLDAGTFPIPALPRPPRGRWKFSSVQVDAYFAQAAVADARTKRRKAA